MLSALAFNVFNSDGEFRSIFHEGITLVFKVISKYSHVGSFKRQFTQSRRKVATAISAD
jgi:hypothetical protein